MSPALAAGVAATLWSMNDLVAVVDAFDARSPGRDWAGSRRRRRMIAAADGE
jgi:hypothetical protein